MILGKVSRTYNGLKPVSGSEIGDSMLGGCRSDKVVVQTALSLRDAEDSVS